MPWLALCTAVVTEIIWGLSLKWAPTTSRPLVAALIPIVLSFLNMGLLSYAMRFLPAGLSYALWTGLGSIGVAVGVYFGLRNIVGSGEIGWICVLAAFPFALGGFFTYNGMTFEKFLLAFIRSELLYPKKLVFRSENLYAKALENSSVKEALRLD